MHHLNLDHQLVPLAMDPSFTACIGNVGKVQVQFRAAAFTSPQLRYMRMVSFTGSGYDVFNLVAIPRSGTSLPILGIDIVSLPRTFTFLPPIFSPLPSSLLPQVLLLACLLIGSTGGALAAIDFQPHVAERNELFQTHSTYQSIASCHAKWQTRLPSGGELPQEAQRYFSPFALWTRIPTTEPGRESKNDGLEKENLHHDDPWVVLGQALEEYVAAYASQLTTLSSDTSVENEAPMDEQFLQDYLTYRIEKDPAKRLLIGRDENHMLLSLLCVDKQSFILFHPHTHTYTLNRCVWSRMDR